MPDRPHPERQIDRAAFERPLAAIVRRLRLGNLLGAIAAGSCCLFGALVVYQLVLAAMPASRTAEPLRWTLGIVLLLALAAVAWRHRRRFTVADAAALADRAADLKDELKSACWFVHAGGDDARERARDGARDRGIDAALVALLLQRADRSAASLDARQVVPRVVPRTGAPALALAVMAMVLAAWSPRWQPAAGDGSAEGTVTQAAAVAAADRAGAADGAGGAGSAGASRSAQGARAGDRPTSEAASRPPFGSSEGAADDGPGSRGRPDRARARIAALPDGDGGRAADGVEPAKPAIERGPGEDRSFAQVARPARHRTGGGDQDAAGDPSTTSGDPFRASMDRQGLDADKSAENDLQRAMKAAEQRAAAEGAPPPAQSGSPDNAGGAGARPDPTEDEETRMSGQMEGNNPGGSGEVAEGTGRHVSLSAAADGLNAARAEQSTSPSEIVATPVEGPRTTRLQARLAKVQIDGPSTGERADDGAEERMYTATRGQRSRLDYRPTASAPRAAAEAATTGERVPLAHREVVKDYFLNMRDADE